MGSVSCVAINAIVVLLSRVVFLAALIKTTCIIHLQLSVTTSSRKEYAIDQHV